MIVYIKPIIFSLGVQIIADMQSTIFVWACKGQEVKIHDFFILIVVTFVFIKLLEDLVIQLIDYINDKNREVRETIGISSELASLIESIIIFLGVIIVCSFQGYTKLVQMYFLLSGFLKLGLFLYLSFFLKQRVLLLLAGAEIFFILFILFTLFNRITLGNNFSLEDLFYMMANFMQTIYIFAIFLISRKFVSDI